MKIFWCFLKETWAFRFICEHYSNEMPKHNHTFDKCDDYDIKYVCSPTQLIIGVKADTKTICHIDSNRWYETFIEDNNNE